MDPSSQTHYQIFQIRDPKRRTSLPAMIPINPHLSLHHATYQLYSENKIPLNFFEKIYYMNRIVHKRYSLHILEPNGLTSFMPVNLTDSLDTTLLKYRGKKIRKSQSHSHSHSQSQSPPLFTISFGEERDPDPDHIETILDIQYDFYRVMMIIALATLKIVHSSHRITREMAIILLIASLYHIVLFSYIMLYYIRRQADPHVRGLFDRFYRDITVFDKDISINAWRLNQWLERKIKWLYDTLIRKPISGLVDKVVTALAGIK